MPAPTTHTSASRSSRSGVNTGSDPLCIHSETVCSPYAPQFAGSGIRPVLGPNRRRRKRGGPRWPQAHHPARASAEAAANARISAGIRTPSSSARFAAPTTSAVRQAPNTSGNAASSITTAT
jgi:hypothetical protein